VLQVVNDDVIHDAELTSRRADAMSASGTSLTRCVRSFDDVTSGLDDDVISPPPSELYARLREVLHENARLKILLWGNKLDRWILQSPVTRLKT